MTDDFVRVQADCRPAEVNSTGPAYAAVFQHDSLLAVVPLRLDLLPLADRPFSHLLHGDLPPAITEDTPLEDALRIMNDHGAVALGVLDRSDHFVGIVTWQGLLAGLLEQSQQRLEESRHVSARQELQRLQGQMASGVVHDANNMLTALIGSLDLLGELATLAPRLNGLLQNAIQAAGDIRATLQRLSNLQRPDAVDGQRVPLDLGLLIQEIHMVTRPKWHGEAMRLGKQIAVETELTPAPPVIANRSELIAALVNLVFNAVDAIPGSGRIHLKLSVRDGFVVVEVADTGHGMSEEERRRCFEPYYTTKGSAGTGLGLTIVEDTVRKLRGWVELESSPAGGSTFRLVLPPAGPRCLPT